MEGEEGKDKVVAENPAAGVNAALPFTPQDVGRAIWLRRPARIQYKTGFWLCWDAWHAEFISVERGWYSMLHEWYVIPLYHWTEKELVEADKNLFSGGHGVEGLLQERERFAAWLAKRMQEQGLEQRWAEQYAAVMKKMPEYAPCFTKKADLLRRGEEE